MTNYEARVLSALLNRQDMVAILGEPLDTMMTTYGDVWHFIQDYYQKNREIPPVSIVNEEFGNWGYDPNLEGSTKWHISKLKDYSVKNIAAEAVDRAKADLKNGELSASSIVERLSKRVSEIQREMGMSRTVDIRDSKSAVQHYNKVKRMSELNDGQPGIPFGFKYMDDAYPTGMASGHFGVIMGYSGKGKSLDVDSVTYDKNGPKRFGDLKVGDYVMGRNGQETQVTGVYPQESREAYKITFSDGTSSIASPDHLWNIQTHKQRQIKYDQSYKTVTTKELIEKYLPREQGEVNQNGKRSKIYHAYLPMPEPVEFEKKDLAVDPYLLGALLANGYFGSTLNCIEFRTNDSWISEKMSIGNPQLRIEEKKYESNTSGRWIIKGLGQYLNNFGFSIQTRSPNKFIPKEYLCGSIEQRKELLAGIVDCDSHLMGRNPMKTRPIYETASRQLMDDFAHLVRGLGGIVEEIKQDDRKENTYYRARFWTPFNPYTLPRLAETYDPSYKPMKAVESIERVEDRDMMCISVDAPDSLYLVDDFIVTHNTWFTIKLLINAWLRGNNVLFINLEMSPEELRDRIYFLISQYSMKDLAKADIDIEGFQLWADDFMKGKAEFNVVGNDNFGDFSVDMIHAKIEQYNPDIVGLDYLSLFIDREYTSEESRRMKNLSRQIKQLAMACEIPIIAIAAVTGKDKKDRNSPPEIAQVAWSSGIEYDANWAIAVHTHLNEKSQLAEKTEIACRKNRNGPLFNFDVKMDLENGIIEEISDEEQMEMLLDSDDDPMAFLDED